MRLILHVGHPKCASTTIQSLLWNNRLDLTRQGIHLLGAEMVLPQETEDWNWALWDINNDITAGDRLVARLPEFRRLGVETLLLSAENLAQPAVLKNIGAAFSYLDVRVLYYIRRQDHFLVSSWRQWAMKRGTSLSQHLLRRVAEGNPNYLSVARNLAQQFGRNAVRVSVLDSDFLQGGSIETDVWDALEIKERHRLDPDRGNPSPDRASLLFLSGHPELFLSEHDDQAVQELLEADVEVPRKLDLDRHIQRSLKMVYDEVNKALVQEFIGRSDGENILKLDGPEDAMSLVLDQTDIIRLRSMAARVNMPSLKRALESL